MASMDGTDAKTECSKDKICNGHVSAEWNGHATRSVYVCTKMPGSLALVGDMGPNTPHKEVRLKAEYDNAESPNYK